MCTHENFASCILKPFERRDDPEAPLFVLNNKGKWAATSLYVDSFGRASVHLPLQLLFPSKSICDSFINEKCIQPAPANASVVDEDSIQAGLLEKVISLEAKVNLTFGTGHAITARVESVSILSTRIDEDGNSIVMETEVIFRVSSVDEALAEGAGIMDPLEASKVKANLDITAAMIEKDPLLSTAPLDESVRRDLKSALRTLPHRDDPLISRTPPLSLQVALIHALELQIRSVPGPTMGHTLVAIQMAHSNRHPYLLRITNIALHPEASSTVATSLTGSDIKNSVQWNFVPEQAYASFPLILPRNEAHSTILSVNATNDACAGLCSGPLTISLEIGSNHRPIVITTDVNWTTRCIALEESNLFRISLNLEKQDGTHIVVGSPFTVALEIANLSSEARHLKLLLDNNDNKLAEKGRWTVVSERDGQKFSLGGPDGDRYLLPMDTALLLGDVKGLSSAHAKLRLIPLQKGTFSIPNFKLVDSRTGNRYQCVHKLRAVVH
jgi:hypothetical protein